MNDYNVSDLAHAEITSLGDHAVVVHVRGEVDAVTVSVFERAVIQAFDRRVRRVLIDLDGVEFFGTHGLSVLVRSRHRALREDVELALVCSNRSVLRPIELAGMSDLFVVSESRIAGRR